VNKDYCHHVDVAKDFQYRSRIVQGLNVPPGKSCESSSGWWWEGWHLSL